MDIYSRLLYYLFASSLFVWAQLMFIRSSNLILIHKLKVVVVFAALTLCVFSNARAEVKCACKSIKAEGEGNSSCSANESGGKCTIDYNLFGDREVRAAEALSGKINGAFTPFPRVNTIDALLKAEGSGNLFDQVFMYLNIAAISQGSREPETVPFDNVGKLYDVVAQHRRNVDAAFSSKTRELVLKGSPGFSSDVFVDVGEVVISPGCIEVWHANQWLMFKAHWALAAQAPGCMQQ